MATLNLFADPLVTPAITPWDAESINRVIPSETCKFPGYLYTTLGLPSQEIPEKVAAWRQEMKGVSFRSAT